jgi:hypothetical protein
MLLNEATSFFEAADMLMRDVRKALEEFRKWSDL